MNVLIGVLALLLISKCHGQTSKSVLYKKTENSAEPFCVSCVLRCANKFAAEEVNPGIKFNETQGLCEGLPFQWLYNQDTDNDATYFVKEHVIATWNPPVILDGLNRRFLLPWLLDTDKAVDVYITARPQWSWIMIDFYGEINNANHTILHMRFQAGRSYVVFNSFNGGWGQEEYSSYTTLSTDVVYKVSFLIFTNYIQVNLNDIQLHQYNNRYPTAHSEGIMLSYTVTKTMSVHKLVFRKNN